MQSNTNALPVAPSGIAQLRKASDNQVHTLNTQHPTIIANTDIMNLDDFILPTSIGTPSGLSPSPSGEKMLNSAIGASHSIPIRKSVNPMEQELHLSRASMPVQQVIAQNEVEFGYVQRHVRKTSIDERRVSEIRASTILVGLSD